MRLLLVSQYFWPENFRVNDLVAGMVERGHEVTVLTGQPNYPYGKFFEGYSWQKPKDERYLGANVLRVPLVPRGRGGGLRLAINYLSFVVFASWAVFFRLPTGNRFDAIFVFQPSPVTVGIPAILARWRYDAPLLFWVLDIWPDSLAAVGSVRSQWILSKIDLLVRWIYHRCDYVLVQSASFVTQVMRQGVSENRIRYFPNWGEDAFSLVLEKDNIRSCSKPRQPLRILYAGNIGAAQDFPSIIEAATLLAGYLDVRWEIYGDGRMAEWSKEEVARRGLSGTIYFKGQHPLEVMPTYFAQADALLVSLKPDPIFSQTVPGKLQSYLASGKPILAMLDGEGARIVAESKSGYHCPAGSAAGLASIIERFANLSEEQRQVLGRNGRAYFEEHFARERVFDRLEEWLKELTGHHWKGRLHD